MESPINLQWTFNSVAVKPKHSVSLSSLLMPTKAQHVDIVALNVILSGKDAVTEPMEVLMQFTQLL